MLWFIRSFRSRLIAHGLCRKHCPRLHRFYSAISGLDLLLSTNTATINHEHNKYTLMIWFSCIMTTHLSHHLDDVREHLLGHIVHQARRNLIHNNNNITDMHKINKINKFERMTITSPSLISIFIIKETCTPPSFRGLKTMPPYSHSALPTALEYSFNNSAAHTVHQLPEGTYRPATQSRHPTEHISTHGITSADT